jgi:hypothetical protein
MRSTGHGRTSRYAQAQRPPFAQASFRKTRLIADLQNNRSDKRAAARTFFFILFGYAGRAPICMAAICFCKYPAFFQVSFM